MLYRTSDFDNQIKGLQKIHKRAYRYLLEMDVHKWSCAYCPVQRYSLMTTNIVESLNSTLKHAHKLLTTAFVEFVHDMIQRWFYEKRNATERIETS